MKKKLPVGIENFEEFISQDFYYIDKTGFIIDLLNNWGKVNLFTRPRRFGKSLKSIDGLNYQSACAALRSTIGMEALRF